MDSHQKLRITARSHDLQQSEGTAQEESIGVGFPSAEFSLYSLRPGNATAAAAAGVPDRVFKKHGHWKYETAKDGYVKDSFRLLHKTCDYSCILWEAGC